MFRQNVGRSPAVANHCIAETITTEFILYHVEDRLSIDKNLFVIRLHSISLSLFLSLSLSHYFYYRFSRFNHIRLTSLSPLCVPPLINVLNPQSSYKLSRLSLSSTHSRMYVRMYVCTRKINVLARVARRTSIESFANLRFSPTSFFFFFFFSFFF